MLTIKPAKSQTIGHNRLEGLTITSCFNPSITRRMRYVYTVDNLSAGPFSTTACLASSIQIAIVRGDWLVSKGLLLLSYSYSPIASWKNRLSINDSDAQEASRPIPYISLKLCKWPWQCCLQTPILLPPPASHISYSYIGETYLDFSLTKFNNHPTPTHH